MKRYVNILCLMLTLLCVTGVACAGENTHTLADFLSPIAAEAGDILERFAVRDPAQEGEATAHVGLSIREALFDGYRAYLVIEARPAAGGLTFIDEMDRDIPSLVEEALAYGEKAMALRCVIGFADPALNDRYTEVISIAREGASLVYGVRMLLLEEAPLDSIAINIRYGAIEEDRFHPDEEGWLSVEIPRTFAAEEAAVSLDVDLGAAKLKSLRVIYTPLDMHALLRYEQVGEETPWFHLQDAEGEFISIGASEGYDEAAKEYFCEMRCTAPAEFPQALWVWSESAAASAMINLEDGVRAISFANEIALGARCRI